MLCFLVLMVTGSARGHHVPEATTSLPCTGTCGKHPGWLQEGTIPPQWRRWSDGPSSDTIHAVHL